MTDHIIPNHFIIVFKPEVPKARCQEHCQWAAELYTQRISARSAAGEEPETSGISHHYSFPTWNGYAGSFDEYVRNEIGSRDEVDFIEPDYKVYTKDFITQDDVPSWGLARISHDEKLTADTRTTYTYDSSAGEGTRAYIIDTGILADHEDFGGRATFGHNAVAGSSDTDKNGHGTHVSGTIGGSTFGVAKKTTLIGVKVLGDNGQGSNSTVIAGLQWAVEHAEADGVTNKSVANMSLGGQSSRAMNDAVAAVVRMGLTVCAAAGNENQLADTSSPASEPTVITVGAIGDGDSEADFSNFGKLVDILAPGINITSAWIDVLGGTSLNKTRTINGTSMATPHVTGLAAYLIAKEGLSGSTAVTKRIKALAAKNSRQVAVLKAGSPNLIAYNGAASST
ncbi:subtilisin-like protein [Choiromyces venosus 120613-1]|uniref:Subtilisin-like protein n=1 Tax=Choiromyces venosus 120613-1 TaxID=1336337 RepID=A0A3N4JDQ5_9PEZI|nr:subtilisin-like protein [Choiromyces venosus 120613-1]